MFRFIASRQTIATKQLLETQWGNVCCFNHPSDISAERDQHSSTDFNYFTSHLSEGVYLYVLRAVT